MARKSKKTTEIEFIEHINPKDEIRVKYDADFYRWDEYYWEALDPIDVDRMAFRYLGDYASAGKCKSCRETLRIQARKIRDPEKLKKDIIPTKNKYLELDASGKIKSTKVNKDYGFTYYVNAELMSDSKFKSAWDSSEFSKFIRRVVPDPKARQLLQEYCGYTFMQTRNLAKMLILTGSGANGKSTFLDIFGDLHYNKFALNPGKLDGFNLQGIEKTTLAIASETDSNVHEQTLKALVSGDPVQLQRKHDINITLKNRSKLIFACNDLPRTKDHSDGFWRRMIVIPFVAKIEEHERDETLATRICENELDLVFTWAMHGLQRLASNSYKFTKSDFVNTTLEEYKIDTNSALGFITQFGMIENDNFSNQKDDVFLDYKEFCVMNGMKPFAAVKFWKIINEYVSKKYGFEVKSKQRRVDSKLKYFINIQMLSTEPDETPGLEDMTPEQIAKAEITL